MWFAILTPGPHPARPVATREATVYCWTAADRRRIDGPLEAIHGGLRVSRRLLYEARLAPAAPRCFACRAAIDVPDADALRERPQTTRLPADVGLPALSSHGTQPALLALAHLRDLRGDEDPDLSEEVLVTLPGEHFAMLFPLGVLPAALGVLGAVVGDLPTPACEDCGTPLPGSPPPAAGRAVRRVERRSHRRAA